MIAEMAAWIDGFECVATRRAADAPTLGAVIVGKPIARIVCEYCHTAVGELFDGRLGIVLCLTVLPSLPLDDVANPTNEPTIRLPNGRSPFILAYRVIDPLPAGAQTYPNGLRLRGRLESGQWCRATCDKRTHLHGVWVRGDALHEAVSRYRSTGRRRNNNVIGTLGRPPDADGRHSV